MRDVTKGGNVYYAQLFVVDKKDFEYISSVGIDLISHQYMTECSKYIEHSFVAYNENSYNLIDSDQFMRLLEQAFSLNYIEEENYRELKQYAEPNLDAIKDLKTYYEKIANKMIGIQRKKTVIPSTINVNKQHLYTNYHNYCDHNDFTVFYLNRYSKNHGWCVKITQNEMGSELVVVYSENPISDIYEEKDYISFMQSYFNDVEFYSHFDVYQKQLTSWEKNEIIRLLEEEQFYAKIAPKMRLKKQSSVGYTGECHIKIKYVENKLGILNKVATKVKAEINGYTQDDSKTACGIDFYKIIDRCRNIAEHGSTLLCKK